MQHRIWYSIKFKCNLIQYNTIKIVNFANNLNLDGEAITCEIDCHKCLVN